MATTAFVLVPISTVTVPTVSLETVYWTITISPGTATTSGSSIVTSSSTRTPEPTTITASSSSQYSDLPPVITQSPSLSTSTLSPTHIQSSTTSSPSATGHPEAAAATTSNKHALIGGLSGSIAGLVLIGLILALLLRRWKNRRQEALDSEKGIVKPIDSRRWTNGTARSGTLRYSSGTVQSGSPMTHVDEDHGMIRMSLHNWARPFAGGRGEGWRESVGPSQLRVTNPDDYSRPETPVRNSIDTSASFLKHPRTALAAVLLGHNRSRTNSRTSLKPSGSLPPIPFFGQNRSRTDSQTSLRPLGPAPQIPEINIDPASPQRPLPVANPTPFRTYTSAPSLSTVYQQPPEDPFKEDISTGYQSTEEQSEVPRDEYQQLGKRSSMAPLSDAAGRTMNQIGGIIHSMRARSQNMTDTPNNRAIRTIRQVSPESTSSLWSSVSRRNNRDTNYSDPFDLDRPSENNYRTPPPPPQQRKSGSWTKRQSMMNLNVTAYEGT